MYNFEIRIRIRIQGGEGEMKRIWVVYSSYESSSCKAFNSAIEKKRNKNTFAELNLELYPMSNTPKSFQSISMNSVSNESMSLQLLALTRQVKIKDFNLDTKMFAFMLKK